MSETPDLRGSSNSHLTDQQREDLSTRALELSARGASQRQIANELGVSPPTVRRLLDYAAQTADPKRRDAVRAEIQASIKAVKRRAWTELDRKVPLTAAQKRAGVDPKDQPRIIQPTSHTLPQLLQRVLDADNALIQLYHLQVTAKDESPTESLADQMRAYEKAKLEGKVQDLRPAAGESNGHPS